LLSQYPVIESESAFPWILISSFDHAQILDLSRQANSWALAPIISKIPDNAEQLIDAIKPYSLHMNDKYLDFALIEQVQRLGVQVMVFTVNDIEQAYRLKKTGINGIFTDYPSVLKDMD
jgi:glycerophosphoryl diester phosphodiesterase